MRADEADAITGLIQRAFADCRGGLQPEPSTLDENGDSIRSALATESIVVVRRAPDRRLRLGPAER